MEVAIVTVGDELLAGDVQNTNATWLAGQLHQQGVDVKRILVAPDEIAPIGTAIDTYQESYDAVLVTGGLGPTHDDVTMAGVGAGLGRDLEVHPMARRWLTKQGITDETLIEEIATLPTGTRMIPNPAGVAPGATVEGVYVFPGPPGELQATFETVAHEFDGGPRYVRRVMAGEPESKLLDPVKTIRNRFDVSVGSYPGDHVTIKLVGGDKEAVEAAASWLREHVQSP